jgi:hypothetical protein
MISKCDLGFRGICSDMDLCLSSSLVGRFPLIFERLGSAASNFFINILFAVVDYRLPAAPSTTKWMP